MSGFEEPLPTTQADSCAYCPRVAGPDEQGFYLYTDDPKRGVRLACVACVRGKRLKVSYRRNAAGTPAIEKRTA